MMLRYWLASFVATIVCFEKWNRRWMTAEERELEAVRRIPSFPGHLFFPRVGDEICSSIRVVLIKSLFFREQLESNTIAVPGS
jgi:hypothetical protein